MIVTIIVGVLAAIAIPSYISTIDKSRYGEAKIQMDCMATQLKAFRVENGYFPKDENRDSPPVDNNENPAIECFILQASGKVPFNSKYDYDRMVPSANSCYVQIAFLGKDGRKDVLNNYTVALYPKPGLYQYSQYPGAPSDSDDLVLSLGTNPLGYAC